MTNNISLNSDFFVHNDTSPPQFYLGLFYADFLYLHMDIAIHPTLDTKAYPNM